MSGKSTSVQEEYIHPRSYRDSARLHMQHWIWNNILGHCLNPCISKETPGMQVADVACGNACWLLDAAEQVPSSCQLSGFDISTAQFPAKEFLPSNVSLQQLDIFENLPTELEGKFDIVHVRAVCVVVKHGDPSILIHNLGKMLKKGGHLQWDDFDPDSFVAYAPNPDVSKTHSDAIIAMWAKYAKKLDLQFRWLSDLSSLLAREGMNIIGYRRFGPKDKVRKASTDNWMMALEETMFVILSRSSETGEAKERFGNLLQKTIEETQAGVGMWIDWLTVVGVKV